MSATSVSPALLGSAVADSLRHGRLPCVLGGDHSCAGGTWSGVARALHGRLGLIWIDAHMDSHTPATSHSGRLHGMPLAWLLGEDDDPLYGLTSGVLDPKHVSLIGVRSYEPEEAIFVVGPRPFAFLKCIEHFLGGRKQRLVPVFRVADFPHKKRHVIPLGKARQLRHIIQTHIQQALDAGALQKSEELLSRFFCKTDGIDFHSGIVSYSNRGS